MIRQNQIQRFLRELLRSLRLQRATRLLSATALTSAAMLAGCVTDKATVCDLQYCDDKTGVAWYKDRATEVSWPCLDNRTDETVAISLEPPNLQRRVDDQPRDICLHEVIQISLSHNQVIESSAMGGVGSKNVLVNPAGVSSVYDPAIQHSGVLFGRGRGVEAALADFDTTFATSMVWGRSDAASSNILGPPRETGAFTSSLRKQFAYGATVNLNHNWNYTGTFINPLFVGNGFPSAYAGNLGVAYRQPLLAGSGVDYTRIAGPVNPQFGAITGVGQGVLIARISEDITIADFEIAVRNAVRDVENAYWDLYLAYRMYDTSVVAHQSAFQTWREAQDRLDVGVLKPADELQARDRLYETKANVETSLNTLYKAETELRRLVGLPMNDGTVLRPSDEPMIAEFIPDWRGSITEALTRRVELRRQKWSVKSVQLQLTAARSLVRPRFDLVGSYDVNGFGDKLISQSNQPLSSGYGSMTQNNLDSWTMGFEFSMPIGFRQARSQVRNLELQLAKANAVLASQERNIAHDVATSIQDVTAAYSAAQSNYKRLAAAHRRVTLLEAEREIGTTTLDLVLRAQASLAAAESEYYRQVVTYNKSITSLKLSTGGLLSENGIFLAEGQWEPDAYNDALLRATARTHAKDAPYLNSEPGEFASPGPTGTVDLYPLAVGEADAASTFPQSPVVPEKDSAPEEEAPAPPED
ncbi:MAG: TolC family protein [Planctomycetaceae bacterium]|nr:TolC family protein [Planctomycetaceae bacterium]